MPLRIRVVGGSGTGKTTFARALAARLDLPHLELDAVNHREGWRHEPEENIVLWAWRAHGVNRDRYRRICLSHSAPGTSPRWYRISSPRQSRRWLAQADRETWPR